MSIHNRVRNFEVGGQNEINLETPTQGRKSEVENLLSHQKALRFSGKPLFNKFLDPVIRSERKDLDFFSPKHAVTQRKDGSVQRQNVPFAGELGLSDPIVSRRLYTTPKSADGHPFTVSEYGKQKVKVGGHLGDRDDQPFYDPGVLVAQSEKELSALERAMLDGYDRSDVIKKTDLICIPVPDKVKIGQGHLGEIWREVKIGEGHLGEIWRDVYQGKLYGRGSPLLRKIQSIDAYGEELNKIPEINKDQLKVLLLGVDVSKRTKGDVENGISADGKRTPIAWIMRNTSTKDQGRARGFQDKADSDSAALIRKYTDMLKSCSHLDAQTAAALHEVYKEEYSVPLLFFTVEKNWYKNVGADTKREFRSLLGFLKEKSRAPQNRT